MRRVTRFAALLCAVALCSHAVGVPPKVAQLWLPKKQADPAASLEEDGVSVGEGVAEADSLTAGTEFAIYADRRSDREFLGLGVVAWSEILRCTA